MSDLKELHAKLFKAIEEIDVKLDSLEDTDGASRTKITNELVKNTEEVWSNPVTQLVASLDNLRDDPDTLAGVYRGIVSALNSQYADKVKEIIEAKVASAPKSEPLITAEEAEELKVTRKELYDNCKMAITLHEAMEGEKLTMPKTRRGSKGKRGKRALTLMTWSIDGEEVAADTKVKELAEMLGFEKQADFTAFLKSKDVNTTNPEGGEISVTLDDGRLLEGFMPEEDDDDENGDDDDIEVVDTSDE